MGGILQGINTHGSLVHNNAPDNKVLNVNALCVRVRFGVFDQAGDEFHRLLRPTTLRSFELLRLACTSSTTCESPERNDLFMFLNVAEVGVCLRHFQAYDREYISLSFHSIMLKS